MEDSTPAYTNLIVKPIIPVGLNQASYRIETVRDLVANSWKRSENSFEMTTTIPVGCTAKVYLPVSVASQWTESGNPLPSTELELPSGTYHFVGK